METILLVPRKNWIKIQFSFFKYVLAVPNLAWFRFFCVFKCSCGSKNNFSDPCFHEGRPRLQYGHTALLVIMCVGVGSCRRWRITKLIEEGKISVNQATVLRRGSAAMLDFFYNHQKNHNFKTNKDRDFSLDEFWNSGQKHSGYIEKNMWEFRNQNKTNLNSPFFYILMAVPL